MKIRSEGSFQPCQSAVKVEISGGRQVSVIPCAPTMLMEINKFLLLAEGVDVSGTPTKEQATMIAIPAMYALLGFVLEDDVIELETKEISYPPAEEELASYPEIIKAYATSIARECEVKAGRRILSWQDIDTLINKALGITAKVEKQKNA